MSVGHHTYLFGEQFQNTNMKGWEHNRLMSNFGLFLFFCSDLPNFCYVSYKLIGKHLSIFCFIGFLFIFEK